MQAGLSALWAGLLNKDQVGLDDDFFALGGNSLLAAEMLAHTRAMFGISADSVRPLTRCLLRDPTLRGFAAGRAGRPRGQAGRRRRPGPRSTSPARPGSASRSGSTGRRRTPRPDWRSPREILLTGATGFLGAHLLRELLDRHHRAGPVPGPRARRRAHALARIAAGRRALRARRPPAGRVVPLAGDLAEPRPRPLRRGDSASSRASIDVIYHAGALVNFIYPYQELRAANVTGTREVIRLAGLYRGIPVHYVSTTAVLAGLGVMGVREVTEDTPLAHPEPLRMGYVETKFVAEELLRNAGRAGLPVAIYRPLDIVGSVAPAPGTPRPRCAR